MKAFQASTLLVAVLAMPAAAEDLATCVSTRLEQGSQAGACVSDGLAACDREPADKPAVAMLCYGRTQKTWGEGIAARMAAIRETAPEQVASIASVEVKYDLLANLMQCDRMEELALIGEGGAEAIQRDKARCTAAATGLTLTRLLLRSQDL